MRRIITVALAALLLLGVVSCSPQQVIPRIFDSIQVFAVEGENTLSVEGNIMAVFYVIEDERVIGWYSNAQIVDNGDGTWDVIGDQGAMSGVNQDLATYELYQYQEIDISYEEDEEFDTLTPLPIYLYDLDLQPITADDLPHSEHIGKLTAVNPALAKPATVTRKYMGVPYDIQCLVTQSVVELYQLGEIEIGDYVLVSFIEESPNGVDKQVAIVTDKVYESW